MADVRINVDATQAAQAMGNLTGQVGRFNQALGQVDQTARRIFGSLQGLSERYQAQGFLGPQDQRLLERRMQQWDQMSRAYELQRQGAIARVAEVRAQSLGTRVDTARIRQAEAVQERLNQRARALATLESAAQDVMAGNIPSSPPAASSGGSGRGMGPPATGPYAPAASGGGGGMGAGGGAGGGGAGAGGGGGGGTGAGGGGTGGGMMPPPSGPYSAWPATIGQMALGYAGTYGAQALHGAIQTAGGVGAGLVGGALRFAARAAPLAIGYTGYQLLSQGLQTYEQRSRGVLAVGSQLDEQYKEIDTTLKNLRESYHVLAQEGVAAMMALGRTTTSIAGLPRNIRTGRAYGIAPEAMGAWQGAMLALSSTAVPQAGILAAIREQAAARGQPVLPVQPFLEASVGIAQIGGVGAPAMPQHYYGNMAAFMGQIGGTRMGLNPVEAAQQYEAGLRAPGDQLTQVMRQRAISRMAQKTPIVNLNGMELNIAGNWWDRQIMMEEGFSLPGYQQALAEEVGLQSRGNPGMQAFWQQKLFGTQTSYQSRRQGERIQAISRQPGGMEGQLNAVPTQADIEKAEAERIARQKDDEAASAGYKLRQRDAELQIAAETKIIESLTNTSNAFVDAAAKATKAYQDNQGAIEAFTTFLREMLPGLTPYLPYAPGGQLIQNLFPGVIQALPGGGGTQPRKPAP